MARAGDRVGPWTLEERLGQGGAAGVWRAHATDDPADRAAIKLLRPHGFRTARERFEREARVLQDLHHPGIVGFRDAGAAPERELLWLAMELVDGRDLGAVIDAGPMDPDAARRLFRELAEALDHAHQRGVFHRDLKPQNVMVRSDGTGVVIDFGIALEPGGAELTREGMLPGTVAYFPPEVFDRGDRPDARLGDVYALGQLLWECLEGRPAYPLDTALSTQQQAVRIIADKLDRPRLRLSDHVPADLAELVELATHPDPEQRLASMAVFARRLGGGKAAAPVSAAAGTVWMHDDPEEAEELPGFVAAAPAPQPSEVPSVPEGSPIPPTGRDGSAEAGASAEPSPWIWVAAGGAIGFALMLLAVVALVAWLRADPAPVPVVPPTRAVTLSAPVDRLLVDGEVTAVGRKTLRVSSDDAHRIELGVGPTCDDGCGPCCACAEVSLDAGEDPARVEVPVRPPTSRTVRVTPRGGDIDAPIAVALDGVDLEPSDGSFVARVDTPATARFAVRVGTCPKASVGCAEADACPAGCWSRIFAERIPCGDRPYQLELAIEAPATGEQSTSAPARRARPLPDPEASVEEDPEPPDPEPELRVDVRVRVVQGGVDGDVVLAQARRRVSELEACWRELPPPLRTLARPRLEARVLRSGEVTDIAMLARSGEVAIDRCVLGAVRDLALPRGQRPGVVEISFGFTVL